MVVQAPPTTAGAAPLSFIWGDNGTMLTPEQIAAQRQIAQSLITRQQAPQNVGQGLNAIGQALLAKSMMSRADASAAAATKSAADAFSSLGDSPSIGSLEAAAGNPYLNDGQSSVVKAMLANRIQQSDPKYQLELKTDQANLGLIGVPAGYQKTADGSVQPIPGGPDDPNLPQNQVALDTKRAVLGLDQAKMQGGFYGDSDTAAAQRIVMTGDPSSKQYAIAYNELYGPKTQTQQTPNGIVTFNIQNPPPSGVVAPTFGAAAAAPSPLQVPSPTATPSVMPADPSALSSAIAAPLTAGAPALVAAPGLQQPAAGQPQVAVPGAPSPAGAAVQAMTGGTFSPITPLVTPNTSNVVPNTAPFNESQARSVDLAGMAIPDLKTAIDNYSALGNPVDQGLQKISGIDPTGLAHGAQSAQYQQAYSATRSAISNILYTVSGAAIGDKELERKIEDLTPQFGDKPPVIGDKLNRLANYVASMASSSKDPATIARAQQALAGIQAAQASVAGYAPASSPSSAPVQLGASGNPASDYAKLPSGALFIAPGSTKVQRKP